MSLLKWFLTTSRYIGIAHQDIDRLWRNRAEFGPRSAELEDLGVLALVHRRRHAPRGLGPHDPDQGRDGRGERRKASYSTRRGQEGLALAGKSAGGRAYGFVPAALSGTSATEIDQQQARVVVRIFELYASGASPRNIAAQLNAAGVASPGSAWRRTWRRKDGKWLASAIHGDVKRGSGILNNRRYIGVMSWGRTEWRGAALASVGRCALHRAREAAALSALRSPELRTV